MSDETDYEGSIDNDDDMSSDDDTETRKLDSDVSSIMLCASECSAFSDLEHIVTFNPTLSVIQYRLSFRKPNGCGALKTVIFFGN